MRHADQQDVEGDLVRRLLALGALDQRDHAVEEALARPCRDAHLDPVGHDPRAAGDRRTVAAGLADHRRRLAGDRGLVDRGDALDHFAVGGDDVAGLDQDEVAGDRACGSTPCSVGRRCRRGQCAWPGSRPACRARAVGARLAAPLGHRLGEIGEIDREPQPGGDLADDRRRRLRRRRESRTKSSVDRSRDDLGDEHHRVA